MTLAVGGALLFKSFARLTAVRPGFDPERVISLKVFLTPPRYRTVAVRQAVHPQQPRSLAAIPGVESVAAVSQLPLGDPSSTQRFEIEGRPSRPATGRPRISRRQRQLFRDPSHPARARACDHRGRSRGQPARRRHQRGVGPDGSGRTRIPSGSASGGPQAYSRSTSRGTRWSAWRRTSRATASTSRSRPRSTRRTRSACSRGSAGTASSCERTASRSRTRERFARR